MGDISSFAPFPRQRTFGLSLSGCIQESIMTLSARFAKIPAPKYESMQVVSSNANSSNGSLRTNNTNNVIYDTAKAVLPSSQPQLIIRPNVSNLVLKNKGKNYYKNKAKTRANNKSMNGFNSKNRGRGFHANYRGRGGNRGNNKSYQTQQNGQFNGGYKSYRTQNSFRQNLVKSPYQRPNNQRRQKVRQLPFVNNNNQNNNQHNNGYSNQYLSNKRQIYNNMKKGGQNNRKNKQRTNNEFNFKHNQFDEAALDRDLDSYHMKNPNVEDRKVVMNSNLDKELDDYWKAQKDEGVTVSKLQQKDQGNGSK